MGIFSVQLAARQYEMDFNGHLNNAAYYDWADHVTLEFLHRAGVVPETFLEKKVGPVILEAQARYLRELRIGERVTVTCEPTYGSGRTFTYLHRFIRGDGVLATELVKTIGMLDHSTRRLVADPHRILRSLAAQPDLLEPAGATAIEQHEKRR
jgi:acyl-CoA thioester hydrolase